MTTQARVGIIRCKDCGSLGVTVNDFRLTAHSCTGAWEDVQEEHFDVSDLNRANIFALPLTYKAKEAMRLYCERVFESLDTTKLEAAKALGIDRRTLYRWWEKWTKEKRLKEKKL